jgi:hypothetical protein
MKIIKEKIILKNLQDLASKNSFGLVKAVVDVEKGIMAIDGELHSDEEELLIKNGSKQYDLWGINIYPNNSGEEFIEFDSMINIRPVQGNRTRSVDDLIIREKIINIVNKLIIK